MSDPFEALVLPTELVEPRRAFARDLRARIEASLSTTPPTTTTPGSEPMSSTTTVSQQTVSTVVPYLTVHDGAAALDFYAEAFGAVENVRYVGDDGRVGHAEIGIGAVQLYLSDEYPDIGVVSPRTLGGSGVTLHLDVADVDALYARAVAAGAEALAEPADQPHGARHGTLRDPFGHRWMLSQTIEEVAADELSRRMDDVGFSVRPSAGSKGGIWASIVSHDAPSLIRLAVDVFGFDDQLVVPGEEPDVVVHSQLAWPEGGIVQISTAGREGNVFAARPTGAQSLYVVTGDPMAVHDRCVDAGLEIVLEPQSPDYDPTGTVFTTRDSEGNLWSFGSYSG